MTNAATKVRAATAGRLRRALAHRAAVPLLALAWALLSTLLYAAAARVVSGAWGYPLDDSWIHQTLARSFAHTGAFAVNPGEPVAGSTAPLWTLLIAAGYALGLPPYAWTLVLGTLAFAATIAAVHALGRLLFPSVPAAALVAAALTAFDWRMAWAAPSGMETGLFVALTLVLVRLGMAADTPLWLVGVAGALATLTRPEGAVLFALTLAARLLVLPSIRARLREGTLTLAVAAALVAPVVLYHLHVFGSPLPATFFAKSAFYREPISLSLIARYAGGLLRLLVSSALIVLAPVAVLAARQRLTRWPPLTHLAPLGWLAALPAMYLLWLPHLYHHGRYLFPLLPLVTLYLVGGTLTALQSASDRRRPLLRMAVAAAGTVGVVLWVYGAVIFAANVRTITGLQVAVARWLVEHTPPTAAVATHDVGAIGYFSGRRVVDMAGLITPALTTTPRDRERILSVLQAEGVAYAAVMPDWYPWFPPEGLAAVEVFRTAAGVGELYEFRVFSLAYR